MTYAAHTQRSRPPGGGLGRTDKGGGIVENLAAGIEDRRDWIRSLGLPAHTTTYFLEAALQNKYEFLQGELQKAPLPRPHSAKADALRGQQEQLGVILQVFRDTGKLATYRDALRRGYSKDAAGRAALRCAFKGPFPPKCREPNLYGLRTALMPMVLAEKARPGPLPRNRVKAPQEPLRTYPRLPRSRSAGRSRQAPWDGCPDWGKHVNSLSQGHLFLAGNEPDFS